MLKSADHGRFVSEEDRKRNPKEVYETGDAAGSWITVFVRRIDNLDDAVLLMDIVNNMPKFWRRKRLVSDLKKRIAELEKRGG